VNEAIISVLGREHPDGRVPGDLATRIRAAAPRVTVIGDVMLDGWWRGDAARMSREGPAPVVDITSRTWVPGGAANTAMNLAALGARVRMVGVVGEDAAGFTLRELLSDAGVDVTSLVTDEAVSTSTKLRIVGGDQVVVRLDEHELPLDLDPLRDRLIHEALAATADVDAELISDYGSGLFGEAMCSALAARRRRPGTTVVDAHDLSPWRPLQPDIVTPNADEAAALLDITLRPDEDRPAIISSLCEELREASGARSVIVTMDREGTLLAGPDGLRHRTHAHPDLERRASGAGDTFVSALTCALACRVPPRTAAEFAQAAADVVVHRFGTSICSTADLEASLGDGTAIVDSLDELALRVSEARAVGYRIVFTNGCFDVLHPGHVGYLRQARRLGDVLVVGLNSDASVRRLKGASRPVNTAEDRAAVLAALECVDYVHVFDDDAPLAMLRRLRPDVYTKGGDYTVDMLPEAEIVRGYGGEVRILDFLGPHSTTALVDRIRAGRPRARASAKSTAGAG
jgi:D-beta-D-heptose 7-phosphate kinase / D-beta-D-heptose 1-phosphate adenosyltransferase